MQPPHLYCLVALFGTSITHSDAFSCLCFPLFFLVQPTHTLTFRSDPLRRVFLDPFLADFRGISSLVCDCVLSNSSMTHFSDTHPYARRTQPLDVS